MAKKFSHNRIKTHRIYTPFEAAEALGCHRQTVLRWIALGLEADQSQKPWLIEGQKLKAYLGARISERKQKLALDHFYCFGCKESQSAAGKMADYVHQSPTNGRLSALCPSCSTIMNKLVRRDDLERIRARIEVTIQQADPRLVSPTVPLSKVTFAQEIKTHVKAQSK